ELRALLVLEPLRARVERLRCFRGIDDLTALTIAAELGDARRFSSAPRTTAFVGLVPSEHSSGTTRARGAITKTGNAHLRRVLVEGVYCAPASPWGAADALGSRRRGRLFPFEHAGSVPAPIQSVSMRTSLASPRSSSG